MRLGLPLCRRKRTDLKFGSEDIKIRKMTETDPKSCFLPLGGERKMRLGSYKEKKKKKQKKMKENKRKGK